MGHESAGSPRSPRTRMLVRRVLHPDLIHRPREITETKSVRGWDVRASETEAAFEAGATRSSARSVAAPPVTTTTVAAAVVIAAAMATPSAVTMVVIIVAAGEQDGT